MMTEYSITESGSLSDIGRRARRLRDHLGMTIDQVAAEARVEKRDVTNLERDADVALGTALAIHEVLSGNGPGDTLFTQPRLRSIDEVEAFEKRRLASR
ncbi:helix-turn-helix transcriptional regulator [Stakelama marina]|uniref:Uncharacterized protein n=1 Tax=Stakelama marina TaxID=2826939 RepID=A0A8T4IIP4_9SPHN|nr:helix-turn-helix transcriptional regulator [Stakelama marina]MBR0553754.1 hypothetical protein [Stakelama marina]